MSNPLHVLSASGNPETRELTKSCAQCLVECPNMRQCGNCKDARYCSSECQILHWPKHKVYKSSIIPQGAVSAIDTTASWTK
jgi:hypothetical protein